MELHNVLAYWKYESEETYLLFLEKNPDINTENLRNKAIEMSY